MKLNGIPIQQPDLSLEEAQNLLENAELIKIHGMLPWGSNHTLLLNAVHGEHKALAVYKPQAGERPLWDFPAGTLCLREVATYVISEALQWHIVPPTVLRNGEFGLGSLQWFVVHDPEENYFTFNDRFESQLVRLAVFDIIINNADRKGGHCLLDDKGKIWAIDHGVSFHTQSKLRTVIWDYAGQSIPKPLLQEMKSLCNKLQEPDLQQTLSTLLSQTEIRALQSRTEHLIKSETLPHPGNDRHSPWPPI